jgi:hypothetical protein
MAKLDMKKHIIVAADQDLVLNAIWFHHNISIIKILSRSIQGNSFALSRNRQKVPLIDRSMVRYLYHDTDKPIS